MHKRVAYNAIDDRRTARLAYVCTPAYENVLLTIYSQSVEQSYAAWVCVLWILLLVLISPSAPALAEVQRFPLIPDESQIATKIKDPFGSIVNGALRLRQGEARGDIDPLQESGSVSLVIDTQSYNSNIGLRDQDVQEHYLEVQQYPLIRFDSTGIEKIERPQSPEDLWQIVRHAPKFPANSLTRVPG